MDKKRILRETEKHVRKEMMGEGTGHDWWHVDRVRKLARRMGREEGADPFIVELGALLHDIADWKFHGGDDKASSRVSERLLSRLGADKATIAAVTHITEHISYKGAQVKNKIATLEGRVVQDADRLDALGAIGIARCFAYGGSKNRPIYDPKAKAASHRSFRSYRKFNSSSLHHFYEKLLLLKDRMNTRAGRRLAVRRHKFVANFLEEFLREWEGK